MQRVLGRFYSDWQVATKRIFCFLTLDRKPRLRSQSYIGPTAVGPNTETDHVLPYCIGWLAARQCSINQHTFDVPQTRGESRIFERGGLIIKKLYSKSVHGALIKYHFGSSRNDASLCAHKLIQV